MKSFFQVFGVLTALLGASQYAMAVQGDSIKCKLEKGANATELKYTHSGFAVEASTVVLTWEVWDPTANGGQGAWAGTGATSMIPTGQGVINPTAAATTPNLVFTTGKKYRAKAELKRGGVVKAGPEYSDEVIAP